MYLVFDEANFVAPSQNIDQLLQIDFKYIFDSYYSLITFFILKKMIFYFTFIEYIKNILCNLKTINLLKAKRVVLKHGVPNGIP